MKNNVIYANKQNRFDYLHNLSAEVREKVLEAAEERLKAEGLSGHNLVQVLESARDSKLCDLEDTLNIEYVENEPLKFYVVNNLRSQQDKTSFDVYRFHSLDEAYDCYSKFSDQYTSALGITISSGREIDIVHSRGGEPILVTDYRIIDGFKDSPLVLQTIDHAIGKLGIQREGNYALFNQWIEIPLDRGENVDSYINNKRLLPEEPKYPISAINEAFCDGRGWVKAEELLKELSDYDPYNNPIHIKVSCINVNYITNDGKEVGQMDVLPSAFGVLVERFKELEKKPSLDAVIKQANEKKEAQINHLENIKANDERGER